MGIEIFKEIFKVAIIIKVIMATLKLMVAIKSFYN